MKKYLDSIRAIDTHDHLWPLEKLRGVARTDQGMGMNLYGLWKTSYFPSVNALTEWKEGMAFDQWWQQAHDDFVNAEATSIYQSQLPAFKDLYGVDFNSLTGTEARNLDRRIFSNYEDEQWVTDVITKRANIELMFIDPFWRYGELKSYYPFQVLVFRVQQFMLGFHPSEFSSDNPNKQPISPYEIAKSYGMPMETLDDYLALLDRAVAEAKKSGAAAMKQAVAYYRTLHFENVSRERAKKAFGRPRIGLTPQEVQDFEDFIMWRLAELSAKYDIPLQIHTGLARLPTSSPMELVNLIEANPKTKFILFHGGMPWVYETAIIAYRFPRNVWLDMNWMPILNYAVTKRALLEWLQIVPSNRIMWGGDSTTPEAIYGAAEVTRRCLAEVLAGMIHDGTLNDKQARRIGRQILRDNALEMFPQLKARLAHED